jgi:hypothetical protein
MKFVLLSLLFLASCGPDSPWTHPMPPYPIATDEDHRHCAHEYPLDAAPDACESNHSGDCCSWEGVETDAGVCRFDYCSSYNDPTCSWDLQYKSCE